MSAARIGDWMQTASGIAYHHLDPRPEDINIGDIAHGLSNICRYNGQCLRFYSVAEHSVLVSLVVPPKFAMQGLMHDATEAYVGDMVRPLKRAMPKFVEVEDLAWRAISARFTLPYELDPTVKRADTDVCLAEKEVLLGPSPKPWSMPGTPADVRIRALAPASAKQLFMNRYFELGGVL